MKTSIRLIIKDDYVSQDGTAPLYLQVFVNGKMTRFPLNLRWPPAQFDKGRGALKSRSKDDADLNDYRLIIQTKTGELNEIFKHYRLSGKVLTIEIMKGEFYNYRQRESFLDFWQREMDDRLKRRKIEEATYICHKSSLAKLKLFKPTLTFAELTPRLLENFRAWLRHHRKNGLSTVEKTMKDVRTYTRRALADKVVFDDPFKVVKVKHIDTTPAVLTLDQVKTLLALYETPDLNPTWRNVLHHFLFACFTGLRISDIRRVRAEWIEEGVLHVRQHKGRNLTQKVVSIPLHEVACRFITEQAGRLFTTYSEQYVRRVLKRIVAAQGWHLQIGTHTARHTFGTNFCELGGKVETLKEYMGHASIKTTMKYVHLSERRKKEQIAVFDHFSK